jgi:NAD-dependent SIR2 family protein deacetylase|tara:strand:- start:8175 stop:8435 length:261 start_codon:yes stop_codon:yes gene_type:complete
MTEKELKALHKQSSNHRDLLEENFRVSCFCCLNTFDYNEITEWVDHNQTALCPKCGIDAVVLKTSKKVLEEMEKRWFGLKKYEQTS